MYDETPGEAEHNRREEVSHSPGAQTGNGAQPELSPEQQISRSITIELCLCQVPARSHTCSSHLPAPALWQLALLAHRVGWARSDRHADGRV